MELCLDQKAFFLFLEEIYNKSLSIDFVDETDLILELVKDICNELDVRSLCHKILQNVGILTDADRYVSTIGKL